jgi:drug/metabolite transporter (DMT)-like permease
MRRLALLAFIWGWSFLFIKVAVAGLTPTTVAWARIALGALVLLAVCRVRRLPLPSDVRTWRHFVVTGLLGSALPFTLLAWGEERITSALTSVLNAATPLFTALAGVFLLRERLRPGQLLGLALGFAGVGIAAGVGGSDLAHSSVTGTAAAVAAGACYGLAFVYAKRHLMDLPTEVAATGQLVTGAVLLAPFAFVTSVAEGVDLTPRRILAVVLLGAIGTGVAYVLFYRLLADLGPTSASLVTYLVPVVAVAVGVAFLDEPFFLRLVAGGVLIVAGILLVNQRQRRGIALVRAG